MLPYDVAEPVADDVEGHGRERLFNQAVLAHRAGAGGLDRTATIGATMPPSE
jgi:hypothetical protein